MKTAGGERARRAEKATPASRRRRPREVAPGLERRVLRFVRERGLTERGQRVLVALSGGADSTALLLVLARLADRLGTEVCAAYFDHRLRGRSAGERERKYAAALTKELGVPLDSGAGDVRDHARASRLSLEEAARELRYRYLAQAAREMSCPLVAVGHTADDQAETVLMHILRGSGLAGLGGMAPRAPWPVRAEGEGPVLVRPLLEVARTEASEYCRERGVGPLEDPTNRSLTPLRNRIRRELLPALRRYNPRVDAALRRLAGAAAADQEVIDGLAASVIDEGSEAREGEVRLSRRRLEELPHALRLHALRLAARRLVGDIRDLGEAHLRAMAEASAKSVGARLDLPHGLRLGVDYDEVFLAVGPAAQTPCPLPDAPVALSVPGVTRVGPWTFETEVAPRSAGTVAADAGEAMLDFAAVDGELSVRRRRAGDRFQPLGLAAEKKLQDFLVDAKVPRSQRDQVPLVCARGGIAWVVGHRIADWAKVRGRGRRLLKITARQSR